MHITIYCIGKKHDAIFAEAINDYSKRLERSVTVTWELLPASGSDERQARQDESEALLKRLPTLSTVWLLDETGDMIDSPGLASKIENIQQSGKNLAIIIGGAYGVNEAMKARADFIWSLSKLVFPHQLVRLLLAEQLYRAYEINRGSGYHHI